ANIDYAERIWEEFTQSIHTFIDDKRNLSQHTSRKKRATLIVIPSVRFTKLIIHHLQRMHRFHPRPDSLLYMSNEEPVLGYLIVYPVHAYIYERQAESISAYDWEEKGNSDFDSKHPLHQAYHSSSSKET
nr:hypothetical protein [Tanacetum cinerariifolium]